MPSVDDNREMWGRSYTWSEAGDEWSSGWGGPEAQWHAWIAPRLRRAIGDDPRLGRAVDIGCGHGRWTRFLADRYDEVVAVDVAPECVDACRERFVGQAGVRVVVCDGSSLPGVGDCSVDLVFSFDSLVHADAGAIAGYVEECSRVLTADGVALIHHSNLAACGRDRRGGGPSGRYRRWFGALGLVEPNVHWRDPTVDAGLVSDLCAERDLVCADQELLRWGTRRAYIDAVSTIRRRRDGVEPTRPTPRLNRDFMAEMERTGRRVGADGARSQAERDGDHLR